jgi:hypothetical protein
MAFEFWSDVTHGGQKPQWIFSRWLRSESVLASSSGSPMSGTLPICSRRWWVRQWGGLRRTRRNSLLWQKLTLFWPRSFDEQSNPENSERQRPVQEPSEQDPEVTIRLEAGHLGLLRSHRCMVTVRTSIGAAQTRDRKPGTHMTKNRT